MTEYLLFGAVIMDCLLGDPRTAFHPVVMIGNLIAWLERRMLPLAQSPVAKKMAGAVLVIMVLTLVYTSVWLVMAALFVVHPWAGYLGGAILLSFTISTRSLAEAGREIAGFLLSGNMEQARYKVGWIVGRDTAKLNTAEVTRATVETVAENIVDGIISPLFYAAIGGVPLAFLYRAVNTMDSMIGYKNDKYYDFGMVAARVDDVFNYIPARITSLFIILAAAILKLDSAGAFRAIRRDAAKHPSPNSGFSEAGVAGALGIRLGGLNYYGGVASLRAYMGEAKCELTPIHIEQTIQIMYAVTVLFVAATVAGKWLLAYL
ncbi:adenosylcobinamide-phosphate synthase CbiB [Sporomusa acidovorans]|uniref:Cobalamin biosynthesis protein CobD n=1 Tax=Sporomusa acidovorans (strain ATCC 49682 / DSM 3132 / Mol) TaxID=1123286 RepID=A0ABZ3J1D2_SPOA4|nr:adenosylcobinamide-phosphate synthase CbiB [Sporomusa acidovorans]OZC15059.1 cobalamin biosynthesis protein CbiB [Sporomusa acidovorans DSM 3132]SDE84824.1 adenosylcobinamide-phosphate synthase [Sporomusa acidovorans]